MIYAHALDRGPEESPALLGKTKKPHTSRDYSPIA
jgi:hypothetical protein